MRGNAFLFHKQQQAFQISPFWVEDVDGMVSGLRQLVDDSHVAFGFDGGGGDDALKRSLVDSLRATESKQ